MLSGRAFQIERGPGGNLEVTLRVGRIDSGAALGARSAGTLPFGRGRSSAAGSPVRTGRRDISELLPERTIGRSNLTLNIGASKPHSPGFRTSPLRVPPLRSRAAGARGPTSS